MILETVKIAFRSLYSNKLRTLLSMLGIIIGVGAVIAVISIAAGSRAQVTGQISDMGSNLININPGFRRTGTGGISTSARELFTPELGQAINDFSPYVKRVTARSSTQGLFIVGDNNYRATLVGTGLDYQTINKYYPARGKFFSNFDLDNARNVIVLGSELVNEIFLKEDNPIGKKVTFNHNGHNYLFTVIGVMEYKERGLTGDLNSQAYIPVTTFIEKISNSRYVDSYLAQAVSSEKAVAAVGQIEYFLGSYFDDKEEFNIMSQDQLLDTIGDITDTLTLMLSGIAGISLLVGGIGIMNIMLVSVTERTREIGIRKALGAKRRNILGQFLVESLTLSSFGGIIGIILGLFGAYSLSRVGGWPFVVSPITVILAFSFSLIVGVFFGIYPALKASRLDPVESLSYE